MERKLSLLPKTKRPETNRLFSDEIDNDSTTPFTAPGSKRRKYATMFASALGIIACGGAFFVLFLGPRGG